MMPAGSSNSISTVDKTGTRPLSPEDTPEARASLPPLSVKNDLRIQNEQYLREHPEIKDVTSYFLKRCLLENPRDVTAFAAALFADPALKDKIRLSLPSSKQ
ncbi:hypothetical protein AMAG_03079 [Allomyces macrogynus ATCC 38327]|uniref:RIIa domain-containing protein n=1 Tax=Allomyces macrogynus (strain ATCC 38327) TaxID=578462 RepID=A0A0L0S4Q0_ALLM3|nr:hypothetical protein AMAG_03079 [Allomyces macrogynus ATCC 38327]|eukprot:KNE57359.1 hypothetical protein AMAG_03079 [Allomyces macrogynus ATCC 38327]